MKAKLSIGWIFVFLASALAPNLLAAKATTAPPASPLARLQGTWNLLETDAHGQSSKTRVPTQWIFRGHQLFLRVGGKTVPRGVVEIDTRKKPMALNLVTQGQTNRLAIFQLNGGKLTVCSGSTERPKVFVADGDHVVDRLERVRVRPLSHRHRALGSPVRKSGAV